MQGVLRDEWGFDGFCMTDWAAYDTVDCIKAVQAGTSLLTPGSRKHRNLLLKAVRKGKLSKAILQDNVKRIIKVYTKGNGVES